MFVFNQLGFFGISSMCVCVILQWAGPTVRSVFFFFLSSPCCYTNKMSVMHSVIWDLVMFLANLLWFIKSAQLDIQTYTYPKIWNLNLYNITCLTWQGIECTIFNTFCFSFSGTSPCNFQVLILSSPKGRFTGWKRGGIAWTRGPLCLKCCIYAQ